MTLDLSPTLTEATVLRKKVSTFFYDANNIFASKKMFKVIFIDIFLKDKNLVVFKTNIKTYQKKNSVV